MPAVQKAASTCGGQRGGRGAGKNGAQKATGKGKGGKQNNEEPLGEAPVTIDEEEEKESPDVKEDSNNNAKEEKKGTRNQTARRGKCFISNTGTCKISTKPCSVDLERQDIDKGGASKKNTGGNGKKEENSKVDMESENKNDQRKKKVETETNMNEQQKVETETNMNEEKKGDNGLLENKTEDASHMNIENVQGEVVVSTDNDIHDEKVSTEPPVQGLHMETLAAYVNDDEIENSVETVTETEKNERLGIIGNSLEISKLETEIDQELVKKIKVYNTEERIERLKELLALLKGYTMSSDRIEMKENKLDRKENQEENDDMKLDTNEVGGSCYWLYVVTLRDVNL